MQVVQLGPFPPPQGGVQTNLVAIRQRLRDAGHQCGVINLTRFRRPNDDDVYYPESALEVARMLRRMPCDILHLHLGGQVFFRLLALALLCTLRRDVKTVLTFHSGGYASTREGRSARYGTLRGLVFRRFDAIIAVNDEIATLFRRFGVAPHRIHLIAPHAMPVVDNLPLPPALEAFFSAHDPVLSTVGLLEPEYDLPLQIDVMGELLKRHSNAGLIIAGAGSLEADLRARIDASPSGRHVLLYGDMPHPVTLKVIARSRAMLRTTLYDGDSVAVREALHLGTPVVATDNHMRPSGVRLVPVQDRHALVQAIQDVLHSAPAVQLSRGDDDLGQVLKVYSELCGAASSSRIAS